MNPRTAAKWIEADQYCRNHSVPPILAQEAAKRVRVAMRQAKPFKASMRLPRGSRPQSIKTLKKKAWDAFSRFIRQKDADENGNVKCCTCPNVRHWSGMDAGHFISRTKESVLFDEMNVHAQCKGCNMRPNNGKPIEYAAFLDERYGSGTAQAITARAYRREMKREEVERILTKYEAASAPEGVPNSSGAVGPINTPVTPVLLPTTQKGES